MTARTTSLADTAAVAARDLARAERSGFGPRFAAAALTGPALNPLNTTMIAVALVPIADATGVSAATALWLVAGLYLVSSVGQPTWGRLADLFGPRRVYLLGLTSAAIGGLIPLFMPTFQGVLIARMLIGLGTSAQYPAAMTLISDQQARLRREPPHSLLAGLSLASLVSISVGPVLGGLLVHYFSWRAIFLVNVPAAILIAALALRFLPPDRSRPAGIGRSDLPIHAALDIPGIVLFAGTTVSSLVFLLDIDAGVWWLLPVALAFATALTLWERRARRPFLDVRMLVRNGALTRTYLRFFLSYIAIFAVTYTVSPWLQEVRGYDADVVGWMLLPAALLAMGANRMVARMPKPRLALSVAAAVQIAGGVLMWLLHSETPLWLVLAIIAMFGVPQGLVAVSNQAALYRQAPVGQVGIASGLSRTFLQIGAMTASALIALTVGDAPTDAGLHRIGAVIVIASCLVLALVLWDRSLSNAADTRDVDFAD
ncbi:MFS transporter [Demequina capsici]|uniref:MFS transporter n=1 Tax=Demequina capsici TaxID=3075620 RepID=A0AA96F939_9MICO|nr:MFS transporter [Demequina sp. PMTSA13]WNM26466.1 MFS transporter [Demequina sp. PMTSA13]